MNNFIKIVVTGAIATLLQRGLGFNPVSLKGFAFFMVVFMAIAFAWQYFVPSIEKKEEPKE